MSARAGVQRMVVACVIAAGLLGTAAGCSATKTALLQIAEHWHITEEQASDIFMLQRGAATRAQQEAAATAALREWRNAEQAAKEERATNVCKMLATSAKIAEPLPSDWINLRGFMQTLSAGAPTNPPDSSFSDLQQNVAGYAAAGQREDSAQIDRTKTLIAKVLDLYCENR
jgi:hypothetical protein